MLLVEVPLQMPVNSIKGSDASGAGDGVRRTLPVEEHDHTASIATSSVDVIPAINPDAIARRITCALLPRTAAASYSRHA
jgi:hypothetical protein